MAYGKRGNLDCMFEDFSGLVGGREFLPSAYPVLTQNLRIQMERSK
jgi:hypothetical protein